MSSPRLNRLLAGLFLLAASAAWAQAPARLGYQGRLLRADGTPESGVQTFIFALWDAPTGGTKLWEETQSLALTDGFYATFLGDVTTLPLTVLNGSERYLQLTVAGNALAPRQRVASVAYALKAELARSVAGGTVNVSSVLINGTTVIDAMGRLAGPAVPSVSFGADAGLVCEGNDVRLSNPRVPTGPAGGDLAGTYPNPTVGRLSGATLLAATPGVGTFLGVNGTGQWTPTALPQATATVPGLVRPGTALSVAAGVLNVQLGTTATTALAGDRLITSTVDLLVPSQFPTVAAALASLNGRRIAPPALVRVRLADGTYPQAGTLNVGHPDGESIQIIGNVTTPANVTLSFSNANGVVLAEGMSLGWLDGVRVLNTAGSTTTGIVVQGGRLSMGTKVEIAGFSYGLYVDSGGFASASGLRVSCLVGASSVGVNVAMGSRAKLPSLVVPAGCGNGLLVQNGAAAYADGAVVAASGFAFAALSNAYLYAYQAQATGASVCFQASGSSSLIASSATATGCSYGYLADYASTIDANASASTNATNVHFFAGVGSSVYALNSSVNGTGVLSQPTANTLGPTGGYVTR